MNNPLAKLALTALALFAAYRGQPEIARRIITDFRANHPYPPGYLLTGLAIISDQYGEFAESLRHARERQAVAEGATAYNYHVASAFINLGMLDEAEAHLSLADGPDLIGSSTLSLRAALNQARNEVAELTALAERLSREARAMYGERANWPRWALRAAGREFSLIGEHARAIEHHQLIYQEPFNQLDYQAVVEELDGMLFYAHSVKSLKRHDEAQTVIRAVLEILASLDQQGYAALPDLVYAKAVAHALLDERALAIATLRQAVSRGWRRYWLVSSDPRWASFRGEADFNQLLAELQIQVAALRNGVDSGSMQTGERADSY